ncbi:MAG: glutamate racemase [Candidatus Kapabacteria bacterium]|nr:glutamate racemase [Ignavibacteriota bacterium]MCW5885333.1 glutamate racemase [Candidatus Kapabacteria bacterium]
MELTKQSPIGVFDSGIGGLSVLKQFIRFLPAENYIYLGDTARVPYGNKSRKTVEQYAGESTEFLLSKGVKIIIVACNTVSAVALEAVKSVAGEIPVIGMIEPAANAALRATRNGKIGIIGTRATITSNAYPDQINYIDNSNEIQVFTQACPLFVPIVEEGMLRHNAAKLIAEDYLKIMKDEDVDTLVLGCTHYPLISHLISEILKDVTLIDSGEHASVSALRLLAENKLLIEPGIEFINKPRINFFITDLPSNFYELAKNFLGIEIDKPELICL